MRSIRKPAFGATLLALSVVLGACGSGGGGGQSSAGGGGAKGSLTVGAVQFAENQIVAEMYAQALEAAGYSVARKTDIGSREVLQPAIKKGDIDLAPEYLSSLLLYLDPSATPSGDPQQVASKDEALLSKRGITLLQPAEANDTNAFVVTQATAQKYGLQTVSDLKDVAGKMTLGGPPECPKRPFCIEGLKKVYGVQFADFKPLDVGGPLTVTALKNGQIDVGLLFSTSSAIKANDFVVLEDDKNLQNAENITPQIRKDLLDSRIEQILNSISAKLNNSNITELNAMVELQHREPADVAKQFLQENGLL